MDVLLPNGKTVTGVPAGTSKADVMAKAIANGLASKSDFDVANHTAPYASDIQAAEQANGIPKGLLSALISKESSGRADATSSKGAIGLTQGMPDTLKDLGYDPAEVAKNPQLQIQAGAKYLGQMLQQTGNVTDALTAYHSGLGNLQKYKSGEKQMGPETAGYASDERFKRWTQPTSPGAENELSTLSAQVNRDVPQAPETSSLPTGEDFAQAGKGLLQAGVNVANIPGSVVNTALGAAGVPQQYQVPTAQLPENLRPTDPYAQAGADIGGYLVPIPGLQAESLASAVAKGSDALIPKIASLIERNVPQSIAENVVGSLAQNASSSNQNNFGAQIAQDTGASLAVRAVAPVAGRVAQAIRGGVARESAPAAREAAEAAPAPAQEPVPTQQVPAAAADDIPISTTPEPAPAAAPPAQAAPATQATPGIPEGGSAEEEALRRAALRSATPEADPNLASSLQGLNVQPRADVQQAATRLNLADDLLPSHLSGNAQYQAVEQALKSRPGSGLALQEDAAISKLAQRAGKIMDAAADADSSAALSTRFNNEMEMRMNALNRRSDQLYKRVDEAMPQNAQIEAPNTAALLNRTADDLGGWENMSTAEKNVFKAVNPAGEKMADGTFAPGVLTYARLNRVRQDVGAALFKSEGVYKDANRAALSRIYGAISEDQRAVLGDVGARRDFEVANRLVAMRKGIEDRMIALRGKDLSGDATRKTTLAVAGLARGDSAQFRRLFEGNGKKGSKAENPLIGTRVHRQQLIANAIGDQLSAGRRGTAFNAAGFADWYGNLRKNGGLALIAKHMPGSFMAELQDLHTVADAIRRAKAKEITTGRLNDFTRRFDRVNKAAQLVANNATKAGAMIGGVAGPLGAAAGVAAGGKIAQVAERVGGAEASAAAERLISSPEFQNQVRRLAAAPTPAAVEKIVPQVNRAVKAQPEYQNLIRSLPPAERVKLARLGLIGWVNSFTDDNQG